MVGYERAMGGGGSLVRILVVLFVVSACGAAIAASALNVKK